MTIVAALLHLPKSHPSNSCLLSLFSTSEANMKFTACLLAVILLMLDSLGVEAKGSPGGFLGTKGSKSKSKTGIIGEVEYDADATPNAIFGGGNTNGFYTCSRNEGIEVCLRAKQRFPATNPNGVWSNEDGTYTVTAGSACPGFSFAPFCNGTPKWSFEWSINTDYDDSEPTGNKISDFDYELGLGCDSKSDSAGSSSSDSSGAEQSDFTTLFPFKTPVSNPLWDHSFGDNGTGQGLGVQASSPGDFQTKTDDFNVAQNSWNYEFFNNAGTCLWTFDPAVETTYKIYLQVKDGSGKVLVRTTIDIITDLDQPLESGSPP
jgi:hypothetical protein